MLPYSIWLKDTRREDSDKSLKEYEIYQFMNLDQEPEMFNLGIIIYKALRLGVRIQIEETYKAYGAIFSLGEFSMSRYYSEEQAVKGIHSQKVIAWDVYETLKKLIELGGVSK